jgi:N4-gp56 family major capsid protein
MAETIYGAPTETPGGTASTIGAQEVVKYLNRKAIIEAVKYSHFSKLSSVQNQPAGYGKTFTKYRYYPLLSDLNTNLQGIDANGVTLLGAGSASNAGYGNLYGSSRDFGLVTSKVPYVAEGADRVNRVGITRTSVSATLQRVGFFADWTDEAMQFDSDLQMRAHFTDELVKGAEQLKEALLQVDLINGAGVSRYAGGATALTNVTAEGADPAILTYDDVIRLGIALDSNRAPKRFTILKGSTLVDTATVNGARALFIPPELITTFMEMKNSNNTEMFVQVEKYASQTTVLEGEIGAIAGFRVIVHQEMLKHAGAVGTVGGMVGTNPGYYATSSRYDVFNCLAVCAESFTSIGFQTNSPEAPKFNLVIKAPGADMVTLANPYGNKGVASIQFFYATLIERADWIGRLRCVAPM